MSAALPLDVLEPRAWAALAACRGRTSVFYATDKLSVATAKAVCRRCPVKLECRADAASWETSYHCYGVRGGLSARERGATPGH